MNDSLLMAAIVVIRFNGITLERFGPVVPWDAAAPSRHTLSVDDLESLVALRRFSTVDRAREQIPPGQRSGFEAFVLRLGLLGLLGPSEHGDLSKPGDEAVARPDHIPRDAGQMILRLPLAMSVGSEGFEAFDHDGGLVIHLAAVELAAAAAFAEGCDDASAVAKQRRTLGERALPDDAFEALVSKLWRTGLIGPDDQDMTSRNSAETQMREAFQAIATLRRRFAELAAEHDVSEALRVKQGGERKVKIVPVHVAGNVPPLSTGMLLAHACAFEGGRLGDVYDFHPRWITEASDAPDDADFPGIYFFSDYIWSHETNLAMSTEIKVRNPGALIVHGGPDCPAYPGEAEAYLRNNPQVDIAVRGEGEATVAELLSALATSVRSAAGPDLSALRGVAGLAYRRGDEVIRTEDRDRLADVDIVPSPYLTGVFDVFGETHQMRMAIIETNRGCPYGCTFCDWGSATNSRIRKFNLQRVFDEFEWCAQNQVPWIFIADANFGIFPRDVEIAEHVVALKEKYGFPKRFITNYAKNTVKHLKEIVGVLAGGGVLSEGLLSLQTMDDDTLAAIRRSNIKLEKYEALAREFHEARMPLFVDLMIGLPGQTTGSLHRDLQQCVDREVNAKCHATELLVNSPMNDPEYRSEHRVESTRPPGAIGVGVANAQNLGPALVVSTASFTRDDYRQMDHMRRTYLLSENLGIMRQVSRFVRSETGTREVDLIESVRRDAMAEPERWPALARTMGIVPDSMVPPVSWWFYISELRDYCVSVVGVQPGSALETVLAVQHAMLPAPGRAFPVKLELAHDYSAWLNHVLAAKDAGHLHDWENVVDRLSGYSPGVLEVSDPNDVCSRAMGTGSSIDPYVDWELASAAARAMPAHYQIH